MDGINWMKLLRCPLCRGEVVDNPAHIICDDCGKAYPVHFGIPDFRLFPPHPDSGYMTQAQDLKVSAELFDLQDRLSFEELVHIKIRRESDYINTPPNLQDFYIKWRLDNHTRAMELKEWIDDRVLDSTYAADNDLGLDIGCGSGSGMATLLKMTDSVVGLDITLSDLILAKNFLEEFYPDRDYFLIAGVAEHLPLACETFSLVLARDVLEHVTDQRNLFKEAHRVMLSGKNFLLNTGSRFLLLEPHFLLPGVGYFPRFLHPFYIRLVRNNYYKVHLPSLWELKKWLNESPFGSKWKIIPSKKIDLKGKPKTKLGRVGRFILKALRHTGLLKVLNRLLAHISYYEVIMEK